MENCSICNIDDQVLWRIEQLETKSKDHERAVNKLVFLQISILIGITTLLITVLLQSLFK